MKRLFRIWIFLFSLFKHLFYTQTIGDMEEMQEKHNCPICGTTCELEYGLEAPVGFETEKEISYTTCKTCKTRWRIRDDPTLPEKVIYEKWACRIPEITIPIPFVGGGIKLGSRWCRWTKIEDKQLPVSTLEMRSEETITRKGKTVEEIIAVGHKEFAEYDFRLVRGDKVEGKIVSDKPVDVWFLDEKNFDRFLEEKRIEVEDEIMSIYEAKIDFKATRKGLWFVVIEHPHKASAKVKVNLRSVHKIDKK